MNFTTYAETSHDLNIIKESGLSEVILSNKFLSRISKIDDFCVLANMAKSLNLKVILEWDILIVENDFDEVVKEFKAIPENLYDCIRVQDPGVLEYVLESTDKQIQFITETGNHNLVGLQKWVSYIGERLDRLVLSIELNKEKIKYYSESIGCDTELLVFGPILLFYSPRKLLASIAEEQGRKLLPVVSDNYLEAIGESEESPHKGFPLIENRHGTFMFHVKDLFLLDKYSELIDLNLNYLRLDLRHLDDLSILKSITQKSSITDQFGQVKSEYGRDVIRGYYQINKSDVLFKKLKNYRIQRKDESYIGEVIEIVKGDYLAVEIKSEQQLSLNDEIKFITPEGREYLCKVHTLKSISLSEVESRGKGELALMNYMGGIWPKSQVYRSLNG